MTRALIKPRQSERELIMDQDFNELLEEAHSLGFTSNHIMKRRDPATVAAETFAYQQAARQGVDIGDPRSIEVIPKAVEHFKEGLLLIFGMPTSKEKEEVSTKLYSDDGSKFVGERMGSRLGSPPNIVLLPPPPLGNTGVTPQYLALATFNTFFTSPDYETAEEREVSPAMNSISEVNTFINQMGPMEEREIVDQSILICGGNGVQMEVDQVSQEDLEMESPAMNSISEASTFIKDTMQVEGVENLGAINQHMEVEVEVEVEHQMDLERETDQSILIYGGDGLPSDGVQMEVDHRLVSQVDLEMEREVSPAMNSISEVDTFIKDKMQVEGVDNLGAIIQDMEVEVEVEHLGAVGQGQAEVFQERLERERLEHQRLESLGQERLEYERLKHERLERERLEQERLEQERLEQERLEQERLKQERLKHEQLERERLERERLERERLEQERLEQERLEQERLDRERLELGRLERERLEQERLEQERLEQERLEQERLEHKQLEQEQLKHERLERERLERERLKNLVLSRRQRWEWLKAFMGTEKMSELRIENYLTPADIVRVTHTHDNLFNDNIMNAYMT